MSAILMQFTNYPNRSGYCHARKPGHRMALCGLYVAIKFAFPEKLIPMMPLCPDCEVKLLEDETT